MKKLLASLVLLGTFSVFSAVASANVSVNEIRQAIKAKGAKWQSNPTWVSEMNSRTKLNILGEVPKSEHEFTSYNKGSRSLISTLLGKRFPKKWDWTNVNGVNYMSPIKNQGNCGSCVAFASSGALEGSVNIANKWPNLNLDFSEQYLFACGGGACNQGWYTDAAASYLKKSGTVDEACMPYKSGATGKDVACSAACTDSNKRIQKIKGYTTVGSGYFANTDSIMEAVTKGPLVARMNVYSDFMTYTGGIYEHVTGQMEGGHAIVIVGYDADEKYWKVRNSWGTSWGEQGYFRIKMNDVSGVGPGSILYDVGQFDEAVAITNVNNRDLISGNFTFKFQTTNKNLTSLKLYLTDGKNIKEVNVPFTRFHDYSVAVDTTKFPDGVYAIKLIGEVTGKGKIESQPRQISILNSKPIMRLQVAKPANGDIVSGTAEINFVSNQVVPFQKVQLRVKGADGKIFGGTNDTPADVTVTSWNTKKRENGTYEIWGVGYLGNEQFESTHITVTVKN